MPRHAPALTAALVAGLALAGPNEAAYAQAVSPTAQPGALPSFADLAERLSPAVVNISTRQTVGSVAEEAPDIPEGSPFEDLFRDFFDRNQRGPRSSSSLGSGFVIDSSGYIVTNNHVIENGDEIVANFADGSSLPAELVGADDKTDIALLKVEPDASLPAVPWGDSDAIRVGEWVMAIGNPFGLGGSVSVGIVSARDRDINAGPYDDFIQTDAAINRGNSGGPLFNLVGEVIGVNTAIISPSGGSIGIGFSVPAEIAENVVGQLREFGETRRGWLGVRIQEVTPEIAESLDMAESYGALVADVTEGGPAAEAGLASGDVVMSFDGERVDSMRELPRMVAETAVGQEVVVEVWRDGALVSLDVTLGRLEEGEVIEASADASSDDGPSAAVTALGLNLVPLTAERRVELGLDDDVDGLLVTEVADDSVAFEKGVRAGDVIVEAAQEPLTSADELATRIDEAREAGRKTLLLLVNTGGEPRFVALPVDGAAAE